MTNILWLIGMAIIAFVAMYTGGLISLLSFIIGMLWLVFGIKIDAVKIKGANDA